MGNEANDWAPERHCAHPWVQQGAVHPAGNCPGCSCHCVHRGGVQGPAEYHEFGAVFVPHPAAAVHHRPADGGQVRGEDAGQAQGGPRADVLRVVRPPAGRSGGHAAHRAHADGFGSQAAVPRGAGARHRDRGARAAGLHAGAAPQRRPGPASAGRHVPAEGGLRPVRAHDAQHRDTHPDWHLAPKCTHQRPGFRRCGCGNPPGL
mmetsp:Transcript_62479/g.148947  ORF Transcript_62479/g.148947 Transcript_62479/m.148947 type:complete len:205 (+) Transcript_62479:369-983(+)